jgi:hypothetical protein
MTDVNIDHNYTNISLHISQLILINVAIINNYTTYQCELMLFHDLQPTAIHMGQSLMMGFISCIL